MAAGESNLILEVEFECAICSDQLKQPKFIGPCNHTFCKDCIYKYWDSLGRRRTIPCPQCRKDCPIPLNVEDDLKDNFKLSNIIEAYGQQQQGNIIPAKDKCVLCLKEASSFCKECDLKLCSGCKEQHHSDPKTNDHDFFGLCPSHGNGLIFFCNACKQAACGKCRVSYHAKGDHDVTATRQVVGNLMSRIQASSTELEGAIKTQVGEQERKLSELRDIVQEKSTSAEVQATASAERTIGGKRNELRGLKAKCQTIQEQIDLLLKKKEKVDDGTQQLVREIDKLEEEKKKTIADVKKKHTQVVEDITQRLRLIDTRREKITTNLEQGRALGTAKITIDNESIANLASISQELADLVKASRESNTVIEDVRRSIGELGLRVDDTKKRRRFGFGRDRISRDDSDDSDDTSNEIFRRYFNFLSIQWDHCLEL